MFSLNGRSHLNSSSQEEKKKRNSRDLVLFISDRSVYRYPHGLMFRLLGLLIFVAGFSTVTGNHFRHLLLSWSREDKDDPSNLSTLITVQSAWDYNRKWRRTFGYLDSLDASNIKNFGDGSPIIEGVEKEVFTSKPGGLMVGGRTYNHTYPNTTHPWSFSIGELACCRFSGLTLNGDLDFPHALSIDLADPVRYSPFIASLPVITFTVGQSSTYHFSAYHELGVTLVVPSSSFSGLLDDPGPPPNCTLDTVAFDLTCEPTHVGLYALVLQFFATGTSVFSMLDVNVQFEATILPPPVVNFTDVSPSQLNEATQTIQAQPGTTLSFVVSSTHPSLPGEQSYVFSHHLPPLATLTPCQEGTTTQTSNNNNPFMSLNNTCTRRLTWTPGDDSVPVTLSFAAATSAGAFSSFTQVHIEFVPVFDPAYVELANPTLRPTTTIHLASALALTGPMFGCSSDLSEGRFHLEIDLTHTPTSSDVPLSATDLLGIDRLTSVRSWSSRPNCYGVPVSQASHPSLFASQSLDNWSLSMSHRTDGPLLSEALVESLGQRSCDVTVDPFCTTNGSPWRTAFNTGSSYQRLVVTSQCLPLYTNGQTLSVTSTCFVNHSFAHNPSPGSISLRFPLLRCPTEASWDLALLSGPGGAIPNECQWYEDDQVIHFSLSSLSMPSLVTQSIDVVSLPLTVGLLPDPALTRQVSSVFQQTQTTLANGTLLTFGQDQFLTLIVDVNEDETSETLATNIPIAILDVHLCRGERGTILSRIESLSSISEETYVPCGGAIPPEQTFPLIMGQSVSNTCGPIESPVLCVDPEYQPKPQAAALDPETYGGLAGAVSLFPFCQGRLGCDGLSFLTSHLKDALGPLEEDELYLIESQVFVGSFYQPSTSRRRRLLETDPFVAYRPAVVGLFLEPLSRLSLSVPDSSSTPQIPSSNIGDTDSHLILSTNTTRNEQTEPSLETIDQTLTRLYDHSVSKLSHLRDQQDNLLLLVILIGVLLMSVVALMSWWKIYKLNK